MHDTTRHVDRAILLPIALASLFAVTACDEDETTDVEGPAGIGEIQHSDGPLPISAEEIAAAERRIVAKLELEELGRVDIVDIGVDEPAFAYVSLGGAGVHDVVRQLHEQDATPAEVFLALSDGETELPDVLAEDHAARAADGMAPSDAPRLLEYSLFRAFDEVFFDCESNGGPESFASWSSDWQWDHNPWIQAPNIWTVNTTAGGTTYYYLSANTARAMAACDAVLSGLPEANLDVVFRGQLVPNGAWSNLYVALDVGNYNSARMYSAGGPYIQYQMGIAQGFGQRAYVAYGNCAGYFYPCESG